MREFVCIFGFFSTLLKWKICIKTPQYVSRQEFTTTLNSEYDRPPNPNHSSAVNLDISRNAEAFLK